jgi:hypothetical protein
MCAAVCGGVCVWVGGWWCVRVRYLVGGCVYHPEAIGHGVPVRQSIEQLCHRTVAQQWPPVIEHVAAFSSDAMKRNLVTTATTSIHHNTHTTHTAHSPSVQRNSSHSQVARPTVTRSLTYLRPHAHTCALAHCTYRYWCKYCVELKCRFCVSQEIDSFFDSKNADEHMPSIEASTAKNRSEDALLLLIAAPSFLRCRRAVAASLLYCRFMADALSRRCRDMHLALNNDFELERQ